MSSSRKELSPAELVRPLRRWFSRSARPLPWRQNAGPYGVWISEIMLQQTQVKTVIPYWERWMAALPDLKSLAAAPTDQLYKLWEGLGYYTRLRNIQKAALLVQEKHGGKFPRNFDDILDLPGIGPYTAGAIASIAFNQPRPILDGNVIRVFARVFGIEEDARAIPIRKKLWALAEQFIVSAGNMRPLSPDICSDANQSLMELGATICTPRKPRCVVCPIRAFCVAYREGTVERLPNLGIRPRGIRREMVAFVVEWRENYLIRRRPPGTVNGSLWEFPNMDAGSEPFLPGGLLFEPFIEISHTIMQNRIRLKVLRAKSKRKISIPGKEGYRWATRAELAQFAFPSAHRSIICALTQTGTCETTLSIVNSAA